MQPSIPATFNETIIVSTTDSEIYMYATSTKNSKIPFIAMCLYCCFIFCGKFRTPVTVLRSAKRAPANVRRRNTSHFLLFSRRTFTGARFAERSTGHDNTNNNNIFRLEFILRKGPFIKETRCLKMKNILNDYIPRKAQFKRKENSEGPICQFVRHFLCDVISFALPKSASLR